MTDMFDGGWIFTDDLREATEAAIGSPDVIRGSWPTARQWFEDDRQMSGAEADFIALASPETILALLLERDLLRRANP
jgi:hypothetical protein